MKIFWLILILFFTVSVQAEMISHISGLHIDSIDLKGDDQSSAIIHGTFHEDESHLIIHQQIIEPDENGKFEIKLPLEKRKNRVLVQSVDYLGNIQSEEIWVNKNQVEVVENAVPVVEMPIVTAEHSETSSNYFSAKLGLGSFSYHEVNGVDISQKTVQADLAYDRALSAAADNRFRAALDLNLTAWSFSESGSTLGIRLFDSEISLAYALIPVKVGFNLSLRAGIFYASTLVSGNTFGVQNLYGPDLYPVISYGLSSGQVISVYFKIAPAVDLQGDVNFTNKLTAVGLTYSTKSGSGAWVYSVDYKDYDANENGVSVSFSNLELMVGRTF